MTDQESLTYLAAGGVGDAGALILLPRLADHPLLHPALHGVGHDGPGDVLV